MTNHDHKPIDRTAIMGVARDLLISAGIGWAGAEGTVALFMAKVPSEYTQYVWFDDLLSLIEIVAGLTVGGLAYAGALHVHARRDQNSQHHADVQNG